MTKLGTPFLQILVKAYNFPRQTRTSDFDPRIPRKPEVLLFPMHWSTLVVPPSPCHLVLAFFLARIQKLEQLPAGFQLHVNLNANLHMVSQSIST